jgi:hypothetical protein
MVARGRRRSDRRREATRGLARLIVHTDPIAVLGIALSAALSISLDLTGAATGVESLLAGLMGTTISLLVDSLARAERRFHLRTLMDGAPWLTSAMVPIVENTKQAIENYPGTRVALEARRRFDRIRTDTDQLRLGRITRLGGDYQDLLGATRTAATRLDTLSNVMPRASGELSWWNSEIGRHYWAVNLEAMRRGVRITRIFAYARLTDDLQQLFDLQRSAGVRVGLLPLGTVDKSLHLNLAVWDGTSAWEGRMSAHGEISENQFTVNPDDLDRLIGAFETCMSVATFPE